MGVNSGKQTEQQGKWREARKMMDSIRGINNNVKVFKNVLSLDFRPVGRSPLKYREANYTLD